MDFRHDGVSIHYVTAGEGDPILFLHGLGGRHENWSHQVASFSRTHRAIAIDLPGHGRSGGGRAISFLDYWRSIEALLDHLELESVTLCGLSKGARAGLMLAVRRPIRVTRMIVVNAFIHLTPEDAKRRHELYDLLTLGDGGVQWAQALLDLMGVRDHPAIVRGFRRSLAEIDPLHIRARFLEMLGFDQRAELADPRCRALIVRGTNDGFIPAYCATDLLASVPCGWHASLDTGHLPYLEDPTRFDCLVRSFLSHR